MYGHFQQPGAETLCT